MSPSRATIIDIRKSFVCCYFESLEHVQKLQTFLKSLSVIVQFLRDFYS